MVRIGLGSLVFLALVALIYTLRECYPVGWSCPRETRAEHPTLVRLVPSVFRHQSWVEVPPEYITPGARVFACTDGQVVGEGIVEEDDVQAGTMRVGVATHWVIWTWITGRLGVWIAKNIEPAGAVFARNIEPGDRQSH